MSILPRAVLLATTVLVLGTAAAVHAADPLPALGVDAMQTSVSGISSGAYMAGQFHLAFSTTVVGAGREGALASRVGGLTPAPGVAGPTSVGYGSSLEGVTALLAMRSSCAAGITVVGIDNGFGAACAVLRLLK